MTVKSNPKYRVVSRDRGIVPFTETDSPVENYEYMREAVNWVINHPASNASGNLRDRFLHFLIRIEKTAERFANDGDQSLPALPAYDSYLELVDEYNHEQGLNAPLRSSAPAAPAAPAPNETRPALAAVPPSNDEPATTSTESTTTATPAASAADEAPAAESNRDDTQAPAWFSSFREELTPRMEQVDAHELTLQGDGTVANPGLEARVKKLERREETLPVDSHGYHSFASSTNQNTNTIRTRSVGSMVRTVFGAFIGTFIVAAIVIGFIGVLVGFGAIVAISHWLWLITLMSIVVAIVVAVRIPPATTASAVTREERN